MVNKTYAPAKSLDDLKAVYTEEARRSYRIFRSAVFLIIITIVALTLAGGGGILAEAGKFLPYTKSSQPPATQLGDQTNELKQAQIAVIAFGRYIDSGTILLSQLQKILKQDPYQHRDLEALEDAFNAATFDLPPNFNNYFMVSASTQMTPQVASPNGLFPLTISLNWPSYIGERSVGSATTTVTQRPIYIGSAVNAPLNVASFNLNVMSQIDDSQLHIILHNIQLAVQAHVAELTRQRNEVMKRIPELEDSIKTYNSRTQSTWSLFAIQVTNRILILLAIVSGIALGLKLIVTQNKHVNGLSSSLFMAYHAAATDAPASHLKAVRDFHARTLGHEVPVEDRSFSVEDLSKIAKELGGLPGISGARPKTDPQ